jgi:hypothetical protein
MDSHPMKEYTYLAPNISVQGASGHNLVVPLEHAMDYNHTDRTHLDYPDHLGQSTTLSGQVDSSGQSKTEGDTIDSYTQGIELSNACRKFYVTRVQVAEGIKAKLNTDIGSSGSRSLDVSMGTLRREVVC